MAEVKQEEAIKLASDVEQETDLEQEDKKEVVQFEKNAEKDREALDSAIDKTNEISQNITNPEIFALANNTLIAAEHAIAAVEKEKNIINTQFTNAQQEEQEKKNLYIQSIIDGSTQEAARKQVYQKAIQNRKTIELKLNAIKSITALQQTGIETIRDDKNFKRGKELFGQEDQQQGALETLKNELSEPDGIKFQLLSLGPQAMQVSSEQKEPAQFIGQEINPTKMVDLVKKFQVVKKVDDPEEVKETEPTPPPPTVDVDDLISEGKSLQNQTQTTITNIRKELQETKTIQFDSDEAIDKRKDLINRFSEINRIRMQLITTAKVLNAQIKKVSSAKQKEISKEGKNLQSSFVRLKSERLKVTREITRLSQEIDPESKYNEIKAEINDINKNKPQRIKEFKLKLNNVKGLSTKLKNQINQTYERLLNVITDPPPVISADELDNFKNLFKVDEIINDINSIRQIPLARDEDTKFSVLINPILNIIRNLNFDVDLVVENLRRETTEQQQKRKKEVEEARILISAPEPLSDPIIFIGDDDDDEEKIGDDIDRPSKSMGIKIKPKSIIPFETLNKIANEKLTLINLFKKEVNVDLNTSQRIRLQKILTNLLFEEEEIDEGKSDTSEVSTKSSRSSTGDSLENIDEDPIERLKNSMNDKTLSIFEKENIIKSFLKIGDNLPVMRMSFKDYWQQTLNNFLKHGEFSDKDVNEEEKKRKGLLRFRNANQPLLTKYARYTSDSFKRFNKNQKDLLHPKNIVRGVVEGNVDNEMLRQLTGELIRRIHSSGVEGDAKTLHNLFIMHSILQQHEPEIKKSDDKPSRPRVMASKKDRLNIARTLANMLSPNVLFEESRKATLVGFQRTSANQRGLTDKVSFVNQEDLLQVATKAKLILDKISTKLDNISTELEKKEPDEDTISTELEKKDPDSDGFIKTEGSHLLKAFRDELFPNLLMNQLSQSNIQNNLNNKDFVNKLKDATGKIIKFLNTKQITTIQRRPSIASEREPTINIIQKEELLRRLEEEAKEKDKFILPSHEHFTPSKGQWFEKFMNYIVFNPQTEKHVNIMKNLTLKRLFMIDHYTGRLFPADKEDIETGSTYIMFTNNKSDSAKGGYFGPWARHSVYYRMGKRRPLFMSYGLDKLKHNIPTLKNNRELIHEKLNRESGNRLWNIAHQFNQNIHGIMKQINNNPMEVSKKIQEGSKRGGSLESFILNPSLDNLNKDAIDYLKLGIQKSKKFLGHSKEFHHRIDQHKKLNVTHQHDHKGASLLHGLDLHPNLGSFIANQVRNRIKVTGSKMNPNPKHVWDAIQVRT